MSYDSLVYEPFYQYIGWFFGVVFFLFWIRLQVRKSNGEMILLFLFSKSWQTMNPFILFMINGMFIKANHVAVVGGDMMGEFLKYFGLIGMNIGVASLIYKKRITKMLKGEDDGDT